MYVYIYINVYIYIFIYLFLYVALYSSSCDPGSESLPTRVSTTMGLRYWFQSRAARPMTLRPLEARPTGAS